jgi:RNA recognition motif-containing protein
MMMQPGLVAPAKRKGGGINMTGMGMQAKKMKGGGGMMSMMGMFGKGWGGGGGGSTKATEDSVGEVRFETAASATKALTLMNGSQMKGQALSVAQDTTSKDGTKILVTNLPPGIEWQELKDHFQQVGDLAYVNIKGGSKSGAKVTGEIRYDTAEAAQQAMAALQGSSMGGSEISISADSSSKDGTKLIVTGVPPGSGWQELKDHFKQAGLPIAYAGISAGSSGTAEVRYDDPAHAQQALQMLNGTILDGATIHVEKAGNSNDGTKLLVTGLGPRTQWQELKDHFKVVGTVAFCEVQPAGFGGGGGFNPMMMQMPFGQGMMLPMMAMMSGMGGKSFNGKAGGLGQYDNKLKVWVGNLPATVDWKALQAHFNTAGKTKWVEVMKKGTGCVVYSSKEGVDAAIAQLNGSELGGALIQVDTWSNKQSN